MLRSFPRRCLRAAALILFVAGSMILLWSPAGAQEEGPYVDVLQIDGPLDGRVLRHVEGALTRADERDVEAVVLELSTEGGLRADGVDLARAVRESPVPVVVWVGPPGSRVTGAGTLVAQAAHVLLMAPATVLGAATPLDLTDPSSTADAELLTDLARLRDRDADLAGAMADGAAVVATGEEADLEAAFDLDALPWAIDRDAVSFRTSTELVESSVAEGVANDLPGAVSLVDGLTVPVQEGPGQERTTTIDLDPATAVTRFDNLGLIDRVLHAMADPTLAYLLLIGGALAILFEVYQPGFGIAGGAGVFLLALSAYGLWVLPINWWALALVAVGLALLAVDLAIAGLGALTVTGTLALGAGSYWLYAGPPPLQAPLWVLALAVAFCVLYFVVIMTTVLRAQGAQAMAGAERVIGQRAVVRSMLNPEGHVFVEGALWRARAPQEEGKIKTGTPVRIVRMSEDGLTLEVEIAEDTEEALHDRV